MARSSRQKINQETLDVNYTLDQMNLTDIYKTFNSGRVTHSSQVHMKQSPGYITC